MTGMGKNCIESMGFIGKKVFSMRPSYNDETLKILMNDS